jgi:hypothetical protein
LGRSSARDFARECQLFGEELGEGAGLGGFTSSPDKTPSPFVSTFLNELSLPRHSSRLMAPSRSRSMAWKRLADSGAPGLGLGKGLGLMRAVGVEEARGVGLGAGVGEGEACHPWTPAGRMDAQSASAIGLGIVIRQALTDYPPKRLRTTK